MKEGSKRYGSEVNRRGMLKSMGVAGLGFAGIDTFDFSETDRLGETKLVSTSFEYDVESIDEKTRRLSEIHLDRPKEHAVDTDENRVVLTKFARPTTAQKFESSGHLVAFGGYERPSQFEGHSESSHLVIERGPDLRPLKGLLVDGVHTPPQVTVTFDGDTAVVGGEKSLEVPQKTEEMVAFDQQDAQILQIDWEPSDEDSTGESVQTTETFQVTPKLKIQNHGTVAVFDAGEKLR